MLFSEGKPLHVKENTPIKENYSRMQSANISSAKLSRPNLKPLTINFGSPLINQKSIVLSPSDLSPELGPEDGLFSPNGVPKLLGSSIFSLQDQERKKEEKTIGSASLLTQEKIINENPFGSSLLSTMEKVERLKDEKDSKNVVSTQESIKTSI